MELHTRVLPPEDLMPELLNLLRETDAVALTVTGGSMLPFLAPGRDTVYLSKPVFPVKRGDIILYQRDSGRYVLHRVCRVGETLTLIGDAQTQPELGIRRDQVRAAVCAVRRKGRLVEPGSFWWVFFEKVWIRLIPVRRQILGAYSALAGKRGSGG